jgi:multidrug efflux pump subunit AcrA (membrane-fusion protein)
VNLSKVKVTADVAEAYSAKLRTGNEVKINFPDLDKEITSRISFASKFINTVNRTFLVEMNLNNNDESYRANMVAVIKINDYHADSATVAPVNVVQKLNGDNYVFIAEKNSSNKYAAKKMKVKIGQTYNGNSEILDGLKEGDKIITLGYQNIEDGQLLKF